MSLNDAISRLTESANRLVDEVSNKQKAINTTLESAIKQVRGEVTKATQDIRATIKNEMRRTFYIDNVNGSDSNIGFDKTKPCKTFSHVSKNMISGGFYVIYLLSDYEFLTDEDSPAFYNVHIIIRPEILTENLQDRPKIKFQYIPHPHFRYSNEYLMRSFQFHGNCSIEFNRVIFELPLVPITHGAGKMYPFGASVIKGNFSHSSSPVLSVRLFRVDIIVPEPSKNEFHLIGNPGGISTITIAQTTMPKEWSDRNKVVYGGRVSEIAFIRAIVDSPTAINHDNSIINDGRIR